VRAVAFCLVAVFAGAAGGQSYPTKPIRMVAAEAGGGGDFAARLIAHELSARFGQQVIVDNRGAAAGLIAGQTVAKAPSDGYTLLMGSVGSLGTIGLRKNPPYDPVKDFAPITLGVRAASALVVHPSLPVTNVKQLIAFARAHPGELNYASSGVGSPSHLAMEFFNTLAGVQTVHIPFKGPAEATTELLTGRSHIIIQSAVSTLAYLQSGRLRVLATTGSKRMTELPAVPTMIEAGLPGYEVYVWYGVLAPAGTSPEIVTRLNHELVRIFNLPDVKAKLLAQGGELATGSPAEFTEFIRNDVAKWNKVIRAAKMEQE